MSAFLAVMGFYAWFVPALVWGIWAFSERFDRRSDAFYADKVRPPAMIGVEVNALDDLEGLY